MNDSVRRNLSTSSPVWPPQREKSIPSVGSWAKKRLSQPPRQINSYKFCSLLCRPSDQVKKAHTQRVVSKVLCVCCRVIPAATSENGFGNRGERKKLDQPQLAAGDRSGLVLQTIAAHALYFYFCLQRGGGTFQSLLGPPLECHSFNFFWNKKPRHAPKINI